MVKVNLITEPINSFSRAIQNLIHLVEKLIGIRNINGTKDYSNLINASWTFIAGLPVGLIIFTTNFSVPIWFSIVAGTLVIYNISNLKG